mgnify:CR=1 FL=1
MNKEDVYNLGFEDYINNLDDLDNGYNIKIQSDEVDKLQNMFIEKGIPVNGPITLNTFSVAVYYHESMIEFVPKNVEMICLVNINNEIGDKVLDSFKGYVFNFVDEKSCIDFLCGYFYAFLYNIPNLDIHDVNTILGHGKGSTEKIRSMNPNEVNDLKGSKGVILFSLIDESIIKKNKDMLYEIYNSIDSQDVGYYFMETSTVTFNKLLVLK